MSQYVCRCKLCWISDSGPFINTVYQQPLGLPTRGCKSLPEWHSYRAYEQQHRKNSSTPLDTDTCVQHVGSCCKVDRKNRTLFLTSLSLCAQVGPGFHPVRHEEKQLRLFPVLAARRVGRASVMIISQFRETGLMHKVGPFALEQIQWFLIKEQVSNGWYGFWLTVFLWGCIYQWVSHTTPVWRKYDWVNPSFARGIWRGSEVLLRFEILWPYHWNVSPRPFCAAALK